MFAWLIGSSLRFRFLVLACAAVLLAAGLHELPRMPVDVFPEFAPPKVEVQTEGPGPAQRAHLHQRAQRADTDVPRAQ